MMELNKRGSEAEVVINGVSPTQAKKSCSDCHTTTTPLWRVGPAGPKSLCNACGIKYNKRRRSRALLGLDRARTDKSKKGKNRGNANHKVGVTLDTDTVLPRSDTQKNKLGEEERAAILLMALSCGSVYA